MDNHYSESRHYQTRTPLTADEVGKLANLVRRVTHSDKLRLSIERKRLRRSGGYDQAAMASAIAQGWQDLSIHISRGEYSSEEDFDIWIEENGRELRINASAPLDTTGIRTKAPPEERTEQRRGLKTPHIAQRVVARRPPWSDPW